MKLLSEKIRIGKTLYNQYINNTDLKKGDIVLDTKDGAYGSVDMIKGDFIATRNGNVIELGIPMSRVTLLKTH